MRGVGFTVPGGSLSLAAYRAHPPNRSRRRPGPPLWRRGGRMKTAKYIELEDRYGAHNYHPLDIVIARAEGVWVEDVEGKRYLDFLAAYSAVNQGHCHPRILKAMQRQARKVTLTSRAFRNDQLPPVLPGDLRTHRLREGAADELGRRGGRDRAQGRAQVGRARSRACPKDQGEIIVCADNFHGRTITIVSFSTDAAVPRWLRSLHPGLQDHPLRRRRRARRGDHAARPSPSWSSPSRAKPASSCRRRASCARCASCATSTTCC